MVSHYSPRQLFPERLPEPSHHACLARVGAGGASARRRPCRSHRRRQGGLTRGGSAGPQGHLGGEPLDKSTSSTLIVILTQRRSSRPPSGISLGLVTAVAERAGGWPDTLLAGRRQREQRRGWAVSATRSQPHQKTDQSNPPQMGGWRSATGATARLIPAFQSIWASASPTATRCSSRPAPSNSAGVRRGGEAGAGDRLTTATTAPGLVLTTTPHRWRCGVGRRRLEAQHRQRTNAFQARSPATPTARHSGRHYRPAELPAPGFTNSQRRSAT